jgi:glucose/mannose transport system substrate-binding protein
LEDGMKRRSFMAFALAPAAAPLLSACGGSGSGSGDEVEVFSWWTGPGEEEGLAELQKLFEKANKGVKFVNSAIAGGGGDQAKAALANRLQSNDPPDSFQGHVGAELADYIDNGVLEDLSKLYDSEGWKDVMHPGLLDGITSDGKFYSVPVNIHRANLLWYNPAVLDEAGVKPPTSWGDLIDQAAKFKKADKTTLAVASLWTQEQLMETVLLGELGPDEYTGLWDGKTDWTSGKVTDALDLFIEVLGVSDLKQAADDWQPQLDRIIDGSAAYAVVGDWAYSYLTSAKKLEFEKDYNVVTTPGSDGVFDYLSDSFTLPAGAQHHDAAQEWLKVCGSTEGQDAFNTKKGSIPARTDIDKSLYKDYLAWNLEQWLDPNTKVVGSLAHGAVARPAWKTELETALGEFVGDKDSAAFAEAVKKAYEDTKK